MHDTQRLEADLVYVRDALRQSGDVGSPAAIWYLWAVISLAGFALLDFAPQYAPHFWLPAGPLGFLASAWLGWRHARAVGQLSRHDASRHVLHWGALLVAILMLVPLAGTGALSGPTLGRVILVVIALAYALAGLHHTRPLAWVALALALGYGATFFLDRYVWTAIGIAGAIGLVVTARSTSRDRPGDA